MTMREGFTRRGFVTTSLSVAAALGLSRRAAALGVQPTVCTLMPEQEVGPFYIPDELLRGDITEGKPGIPLELRIAVVDSRTCQPLGKAAIDVWQCDALGVYSGFSNMSRMGGPGERGGPGGPEGPGRRGGPPPGEGGPPFGPGGPPFGPGGPPAQTPTDKLTFCRGIQLTKASGIATFKTVFPGFYQGRTNHIHFKVRVDGQANQTYEGGHTSHIGQVFFDEAICRTLMELEPYRSHAIHRTTQEEDGIFQGEHGAASLAQLEPVKKGDIKRGYRAYLLAGVDPTATPAPVGGRGGPGRGRGRAG
jgi:protocatechuate 3,4-dioxygenase beta subunit